LGLRNLDSLPCKGIFEMIKNELKTMETSKGMKTSS
jgi:hypothetical protein